MLLSPSEWVHCRDGQVIWTYRGMHMVSWPFLPFHNPFLHLLGFNVVFWSRGKAGAIASVFHPKKGRYAARSVVLKALYSWASLGLLLKVKVLSKEWKNYDIHTWLALVICTPGQNEKALVRFLVPFNACWEACGFGSNFSKVCSFCHASSQVTILHRDFPLPLPPHMAWKERWKIFILHAPGLPEIVKAFYQPLCNSLSSSGMSLCQRVSQLSGQPPGCRRVLSCHGTKHCLCCGLRLTMGAKTQQNTEHITSNTCWWNALGLMSRSRQGHELMQHSFCKHITEVKLFPFF